MKTYQIIPILAILLILPILSQNVTSAATQSNVAIFNITVTASGGASFNTESSNYSLIIGEPVVGQVNTDKSNISFGFFQAQKTLGGFAVVINQAPNTPIWIYPTNGTLVLDNSLVVLEYTASDDDGDALTYYIYENGTFKETSSGNTSDIFNNGGYSYTVSAYDGSKWSNNATTIFEVDVPLSVDWPLAVIVMYVSSIIFFVFMGIAIKDKQIDKIITESGVQEKEIRNGLLTLLKMFFILSSPGLVIGGIHIGREIAIAGSAPGSVTNALLNIMQFSIAAYILLLLVFLIFLAAGALNLHLNIFKQAEQGFKLRRLDRSGKKR